MEQINIYFPLIPKNEVKDGVLVGFSLDSNHFTVLAVVPFGESDI